MSVLLALSGRMSKLLFDGFVDFPSFRLLGLADSGAKYSTVAGLIKRFSLRLFSQMSTERSSSDFTSDEVIFFKLMFWLSSLVNRSKSWSDIWRPDRADDFDFVVSLGRKIYSCIALIFAILALTS